MTDTEAIKVQQRIEAIVSELKEIEHAVKLGSQDASLPLRHARLLRVYDVLIQRKDLLIRLSGDRFSKNAPFSLLLCLI